MENVAKIVKLNLSSTTQNFVDYRNGKNSDTHE